MGAVVLPLQGIPEPRVSGPELKHRLVLLGIILFQPEQFVDSVHRPIMMFIISACVMCEYSDFSAHVGHSFPA
jgi:hypothetical protein